MCVCESTVNESGKGRGWEVRKEKKTRFGREAAMRNGMGGTTGKGRKEWNDGLEGNR